MGIYDGYDDYHVRDDDERPGCEHDTADSERIYQESEGGICEQCSRCDAEVPACCEIDRSHGIAAVVDECGEAYCRGCAMQFADEDRRDRVLGHLPTRSYLERWAERVMRGESPQAAADALRLERVDVEARALLVEPLRAAEAMRGAV